MTTYYPQNMKYIVALILTATTAVAIYLLYKEMRTMKTDIVELKRRTLHHLEVMNAHEQILASSSGEKKTLPAASSSSSSSSSASTTIKEEENEGATAAAPKNEKKVDKGKKKVQFAEPIAVDAAVQQSTSSSPFGIPFNSPYIFIEQVDIPMQPPPPPMVYMNSNNETATTTSISHEEVAGEPMDKDEILSYWHAVRSELNATPTPMATINEIEEEEDIQETAPEQEREEGEIAAEEEEEQGGEEEIIEKEEEEVKQGPPPVLPAPEAGGSIQVTPICVEVVKSGRRKGELCGRDAITPEGRCRMHATK